MYLYSLKYIPVIDPDRCTGCRKCLAVCHPGVLQPDACRKVSVCQPEYCDSDGGCVELCPENAIDMRWVEMSGDRSLGRWQYVYV